MVAYLLLPACEDLAATRTSTADMQTTLGEMQKDTSAMNASLSGLGTRLGETRESVKELETPLRDMSHAIDSEDPKGLRQLLQDSNAELTALRQRCDIALSAAGVVALIALGLALVGWFDRDREPGRVAPPGADARRQVLGWAVTAMLLFAMLWLVVRIVPSLVAR